MSANEYRQNANRGHPGPARLDRRRRSSGWRATTRRASGSTPTCIARRNWSAARGTMQVTTPKGRWLVPPDRAVWVPARLEHAIDVLADIDMRTLYFDLAGWRASRAATASMPNSSSGCPRSCTRPSWRCSTAATIAERTGLLVRLAVLELHQCRGCHDLHPAAA